MKKLKKTVCVLLAVLLLCGVSAMAVHAQEEQTPDMAALLEAFKGYLDENGVEYRDAEENVHVEFILEVNGWTIFYGTSGKSNPMGGLDRIGKYVFESSSWEIPYVVALYAQKDKNILTLKEAYQTGEIDIEKVANTTSKHIKVYFAGDTDMDGKVTVADVLNVQNVLAKRTQIIGPFLFDCFYDYDGNGEITVEDVLSMQKAVAKIA